MSRPPRMFLLNHPHHIVQRGHNRNVVFFEQNDYRLYLENLKELKQELNVRVHCFCLMTNHVHLILAPVDSAGSISTLMKHLAARQTRHVNKRKGRTGSLWEGRFKASTIENDAYMLQCCRYIELNPVRAKLVTRPEEYPWSSYRHHVGEQRLAWMDASSSLAGLSSTEAGRHDRYRRFVEQDPGRDDAFIRQALQRNQLTGTTAFIDKVESRTGIRIDNRRQGRPRKRQK